MPRRIADYCAERRLERPEPAATIGGFTIAVSMIPFLWNVFITLRNGETAGDDPWEGNTLEWATSSPPPPYNFDHLPEIRSERPVFDARHGATTGHDDDRRTAGPHARGRATRPPGATPRREGGISNVILGMLLFITSEVMFFAGLFAAYFNVRATAPVWPPLELDRLPARAPDHPDRRPATILLIISSFTCQLGVWAIRKNDRTGSSGTSG